jgi:hypothetical protein
MNDRARAVSLLRQAREILVRRLTERVLENAEELLDDARGESYMGEIDALYDQIGTPLAHLNQILSALPVDDEVHTHDVHAQHAAAHSYAEIVPPAWPELPALPAPRTALPIEVVIDAPTADGLLQTFAARIQAGDVEGAGDALAALFDLSVERAHRCAQHFRQQLLEEPGYVVHAMHLKREVQTGGYNSALMLLYQCFGLSGIESIGVLHVLRSRLPGT